MQAMLLVGWYTGLRRGSLLSLRPADVDLETRWIYVPATAMKNFVGKRFRSARTRASAHEQSGTRGRRVFPFSDGSKGSPPLLRCFRVTLELAGVSKSRFATVTGTSCAAQPPRMWRCRRAWPQRPHCWGIRRAIC